MRASKIKELYSDCWLIAEELKKAKETAEKTCRRLSTRKGDNVKELVAQREFSLIDAAYNFINAAMDALSLLEERKKERAK